MASSDPRRTVVPTLEDVARAAGVSRATVSRVVNGAPNVSSELQRVVQDAVAAVGYVPNRAARQLITGRSGVIALVMSIVPGPDSRVGAPDDGHADGAAAGAGAGNVEAGGRAEAAAEAQAASDAQAAAEVRGAAEARHATEVHDAADAGAAAEVFLSTEKPSTSARSTSAHPTSASSAAEPCASAPSTVGPCASAPSTAEPCASAPSTSERSASSPSRVFADPFFGRIVAGVLDFLRPRHLHPLLMLAEDEDSRAQVLDHLRQGAADGALVVSIDPADPLPELLVEAGLPAVFFARPERPLPVRYVDLAHQDGGRLAAERLLALGRRRVAVIAGPLALHAGRARLDGFCETMARRGVAYVPYIVGNFTQDSGERAMRELLDREPRLDGVFAANDLMAVGALHVLAERGRRVPQDVAVVGFDDSSAATSARPRLTTVRQPVEAMAARMAELLLERLDTPDAPPRAVLFDTELVVRASG